MARTFQPVHIAIERQKLLISNDNPICANLRNLRFLLYPFHLGVLAFIFGPG